MLALRKGPQFHITYDVLSDRTGVIAASCR
jgi:hypothetical protein